ncbi:hypothetical protein [Thermus phage P23-45]|uniref:Uncharacterized protein n=1 Tax=Thermus virus P23-45 TaxID=2914006 RepID=A7XXC5_BP234|nr:hypothetical protein P23p91 [Thermus phage P23-45]ABU96924.1 hypothetical protein P23p91 [Thermus phage P23-45]UYB98500.1 hypothetical protein [Thermus phage P23-45]
MLPEVSVDEVWYYMPAEVRRPEEVVREGQGGVSLAAFRHIKNGVMAEAASHLKANGVPEGLWNHELIRDYILMQIAARILRRVRAYQELADSLFADSNIKLRAFLEGVAQVAPDVGTGDWVEDEAILPPF